MSCPPGAADRGKTGREELSGGCGKAKGRKGGGRRGECSLKAVAGQPAGGSWRWAEPEGLGLPPDVTIQLLRFTAQGKEKGEGSSWSSRQQGGQAASDSERALGTGVGERGGGVVSAAVGGPSNPRAGSRSKGKAAICKGACVRNHGLHFCGNWS